MSIQQLKSNMYRFGITDTAKSAEIAYKVFKTPQVIPSQIPDCIGSQQVATRSGNQSTFSMPITICKHIFFILAPNVHF